MKNSELIINPDGSVYHLSLQPGEIAKTIITVGDQDRVSEVSKYFDSIELERSNREFVAHTGYIGNKRLSVISTGIGTDNVDIVFNELHCLFNVDFKTRENLDHEELTFIRLGTSGAISASTEIDTILASQAALGYDGLLHFYKNDLSPVEVEVMLLDHPELRALPKPYYAEGDADLMKHFQGTYDMHGVTVTAPGFYAPQGREVNAETKVKGFLEILGKLKIEEEPITNLEMETAGIYGLSKLLGHKAISISAILANRITGEFSKDPSKIVDKMIQKCLEKIIELH